jgi:hypothetical protein
LSVHHRDESDGALDYHHFKGIDTDGQLVPALSEFKPMCFEGVNLLLAVAAQDHADHAVDVAISIVTVLISVFVSWLTATVTIKGDERRAIRTENMRLIEWAIEYPFLESDEYCKTWPNTTRSDDDNMRYENYCCHVFNTLQHAWELHKGNEQKIRVTLYPEELIERHRAWWMHEDVNQRGYPPDFRQFVASVIRNLEKETGRGSKSDTN